MNNVKKVLFLLLIIVTLSLSSYSQNWLGKIIPMETKVSELKNYLEVEPNETIEDKNFYKLKEGNLFVWFSLGNCTEGAWGKWNVKEGTIISFSFYPTKPKPPSFFNLNKNGLKEVFSHGHYIYYDDQKGLNFSVSENSGKVDRINYHPANKYQNLKCDSLTFNENRDQTRLTLF